MGMIHEEEELFTTVEAARELEVHPNTVRKLIKDEVLTRRRASGRRYLLVTADSVRAYKEAQHLNINDLATRLLLLEQKVNQLVTAQTTGRDDEILSQISEVFEKNHPHLS